MIPVIIDACRKIGARLETHTEVLTSYFLFELTDAQPSFRYVKKGDPITVPRRCDRSSDVKPNHFYDTGKYVLAASGRTQNRVAWWDQFIADLRATKDRKLITAATQARDNLERWRMFQVEGECYFVLGPGVRRPKHEGKVTANNFPEHSIMETFWFVPCYRGKPIAEMPSVRAWWDQQSKTIADPVEDCTDIDVITGEPCIPVPTHASVKALQNTKFVGFDTASPSFARSLKPGEKPLKAGYNFPVSATTNAHYTAGLSHLVERYAITYRPKDMTYSAGEYLLLWCEDDLDNPVLAACRAVLSPGWNNAKDEWKALVEVEGPDQPVRILSMRLSKGRVAVLDFSQSTTETIRQNLLKFHRVFGDITVGRALSVSYAGIPIIPMGAFLPLAQGILLGRSVPMTIQARVSHYIQLLLLKDDGNSLYARRLALSWLGIPQTMTGGFMAFELDEEPKLEDYIDLNQTGSMAYNYGLLAGYYYGLRRVHHIRDKWGIQAAAADRVIREAITSPSAWFARHVPHAHTYIEKISSGSKYKPFVGLFLTTMLKFQGWAPMRLSPVNRVRTLQGWSHSYTYVITFLGYVAPANQRRLAELNGEDEDAA